MKYDHIPKGCKVYNEGKFIGFINREFNTDYVPQVHDFDPPIEKGTRLDQLSFYYNDVCIYRHPYFIELDEK